MRSHRDTLHVWLALKSARWNTKLLIHICDHLGHFAVRPEHSPLSSPICQNIDLIPILTWNKWERPNIKTIAAATPILCRGKSGATSCQLKCEAIKNTAIALRNVDPCVARTYAAGRPGPFSLGSTVRFANRQIRCFPIPFSQTVKAKSSSVPVFVVGATFIVTYGWMGKEQNQWQRRWWMRQE